MRQRKVGVMVESFPMPIMDGIKKASELGLDGFQVFVTGGVMAPENMTKTGRDDFKAYVASPGLVISALCADYGYGFLDANKNEEYVPKSLACVDLAVDLGTNVITTHIGTLPTDMNDPSYKVCQEAMTVLAKYAESKGIYFASETGPECAEELYAFLKTIPSKGIAVNYDPANLAMNGFDHINGVRVLKDYIVHTHAKDGVQYSKPDRSVPSPLEVPLGKGNVDFPTYLAVLDEVGFDGFLTIERETGEDPAADIIEAAGYLRTL